MFNWLLWWPYCMYCICFALIHVNWAALMMLIPFVCSLAKLNHWTLHLSIVQRFHTAILFNLQSMFHYLMEVNRSLPYLHTYGELFWQEWFGKKNSFENILLVFSDVWQHGRTCSIKWWLHASISIPIVHLKWCLPPLSASVKKLFRTCSKMICISRPYFSEDR